MRKVIGKTLVITGISIFVCLEILGFILVALVFLELARVWGIVGLIMDVVLFPVVYALAPWYGLATRGDWLPVVVVYGAIVPLVGLVVGGRRVAGG